MKPNLTLKILQTLKEMSIEGVELCEAIVIAGYGAPASRIGKIQEEIRKGRIATGATPTVKQQRRNYQKLVSKLKAEGLLKTEEKDGQNFFSITSAGKLKLALMEANASRRLPEIRYEMTPSERPIIISFDIPEKHKRKREWLREVLKRLKLKMVHKSVWMGKGSIPKQFLEDMADLGLVDYVEIFEVSKTGTLRSIS